MEGKDESKSIEGESSDISTVFTTCSSKQTYDIDDPYGLLDSEHIAAAAEDAAVLSRRDKGRKRKYKTEDERREANRKLAAASRQRKKAYVEHLMQEIDNLRKDNDSLRKENEFLRAENTNLRVDKSQYLSASVNSALSPLSSQQVQGLLSRSLLNQDSSSSSILNIHNRGNINHGVMKRSSSLDQCLTGKYLPSYSGVSPSHIGGNSLNQSFLNTPNQSFLKRSSSLDQVMAGRQQAPSYPSLNTGQINCSSLSQFQNTLKRNSLDDEIEEKRRKCKLLDDMTAQYISSLRKSQK